MKESTIIIGDLHLLLDDQRLKVFSDFWDYFKTLHIFNEPIIFLGDIFNKSLMSGEVIDFFIGKLQELEDTCPIIIIQGNHDFSKQFKSIIKPLRRHKNITVLMDKTEMTLVGNKCLFLPYRYTAKEDYKDITGEYNYIFGHYTDPADQFSKEEGIEIQAQGKKILGHIHIQNDRCLGVPYVIRRGEQENNFRLARIYDDKTVEYIPLPKFFEYVDIDYNDNISEIVLPMNYQLIINNAPTRKLAREKFKGHLIYEINILAEELKISDIIENEVDFKKKKTIDDYFQAWVKDRKEPVEKDVYDILLALLKKPIELT